MPVKVKPTGLRPGDVLYDNVCGRVRVMKVRRYLMSKEPRRYGVRIEFTNGLVREWPAFGKFVQVFRGLGA